MIHSTSKKRQNGVAYIDGDREPAVFIRANTRKSKRKDFLCLSQIGLDDLSRRELTGSAFRVLIHLISICDWRLDDLAVQMPTRVRLAESTEMSIGSCQKAIKDLQKEGLIEITRNPNTGRYDCYLHRSLIAIQYK